MLLLLPSKSCEQIGKRLKLDYHSLNQELLEDRPRPMKVMKRVFWIDFCYSKNLCGLCVMFSAWSGTKTLDNKICPGILLDYKTCPGNRLYKTVFKLRSQPLKCLVFHAVKLVNNWARIEKATRWIQDVDGF